MSKYLSSVSITEFDNEVKHAYQGGGYLRNTVTTRMNVKGDTYKFRNMGKGLATEKVGHASFVTPMDITHAFATATLLNYQAPEYTDIFDIPEVNFDEKIELASVIANALGRTDDQIIIDSIGGVTFSTTPTSAQGYQIAAGGTQLTVDKLTDAMTQLRGRGVRDKELYCMHTAEDLKNLLGEAEVTSSDYNNIKALVRGEVDTYLGMKFILIESREEGGLPTNKAYVYAKSAVGYACGFEKETEINYIPDRGSWLVVGWLKAGAAVRDPVGTVEINMA
jgi:hypothetical protein